jgi:predicted N-formylglutamate amidohydrolase
MQASLLDADGEASERPTALIENAEGGSPFILICEHASNHLPARYEKLGLSDTDLETHIAWDPGALGVAQGLSKALDAPLIHATVSRLVLDLNRDPSAPDSIWTISERTTIPGNLNLDPQERAQRVRDVYHGFHDAVDAFIRQRSDVTRSIVSIHSFTPVYRDVARPWHVGLIHGEDDRLARAVETGLRRDDDLVVGMNEPYSPADRVYHTLERHAERRGLAPLMIEIRNDLICTQEAQAQWAERFAIFLEEARRSL